MASLRGRVDSLLQREANHALLQSTLYNASLALEVNTLSLLTLSQDFLEQIDSLQGDLEQARNAEKHYYNLMNQATQDNRDLQKSMDRDRFVVALLDGDSMPFLDSFVTRGFEGGIEVGRQLRQALSDCHQTNPLHRGDDKIVIYISANLHGLSHAYIHAGITSDVSVVRSFFVGISQSHPLTNFVDAGRQKEAADSKLRAQMELYYSNTHCQQVIFGGSDSGYAPFLDTFAKPKDVNKRITILKPAHMPGAMNRTMAQFLAICLPEIFRSAKIVTTQSGATTPSSKNKRPPSDVLAPPDRKPAAPVYLGSILDVKKLNAPQDVQKITHEEYRPENPFLVEKPQPKEVYFVNEYGQRLDQPLLYDQQYLRYLFNKKARLCNNHYLRGFCPYGEGCSWDHSEPLSPLQLDTLRYKARTSACRDPYCTDVHCTLGHMCPRTAGECAVDACKFLPQQHDLSCARTYEVNPATGERKQECPGEPFLYRTKRELERYRRPSTVSETIRRYSSESDPTASDFSTEGIGSTRPTHAVSNGQEIRLLNAALLNASEPAMGANSEISIKDENDLVLDDLLAAYASGAQSRSGSRVTASDYFNEVNQL